MAFLVKGYPKNRDFDILERRGNKVKVSDGFTKSRWVDSCDIAEVHDAVTGLNRNSKMTRNSDLVGLRRSFFKQRFTDTDLMLAYVERGMPTWLAPLAIGYEESNLAFIYRESKPHEVYNGGYSPRTVKINSQIQVATELPLSLVNEEPQSGYGSKSVIAQWSMHDFNPEVDVVRVSRMESEEINDDLFVVRHYSEVSELGALDGELTRISIYRRKEEDFNGWKGYDIIRESTPQGDFEWKSYNFSYSGMPYLNGAQQMRLFSQSPIECLKGE